jgi:CelD/BcsL family acetyltransferase involved in cellulose biosynthesis
VSLETYIFDEDAGAWDRLLESLPARQQDVYFTSAYHLLWQRNGDGRALGVVFDDGGSRVLYPFLLRDLDEVPWLGADFADFHDIQTPYGYGGPLVDRPTGAERVVDSFRSEFERWCADNHIVSEFVRFHPLLDTHLGLEKHLEVVRHNTTVWCRTDCTVGERLQNLSGSTRRGVRKAKKAGLTVQSESSDEAYARFAELYRQTMERRDATPYYRFADDYFRDFRELLGTRQELLTVRHEGKIIAAALFMRSPQFLHYHLGASDAEYLPLRPNNLLFFEAMQWGCSCGGAAMHLGGGYQPDDELFRFKAGFSPLRASFHIGHKVHLEEECERATAARRAAGPLTDEAFFPPYRAPLPPASP